MVEERAAGNKLLYRDMLAQFAARAVHVHFTPTYGPWLNLVERWGRETHTETDPALRPSQRYQVGARAPFMRFLMRAMPIPNLVWTKSADEILASFVRFA